MEIQLWGALLILVLIADAITIGFMGTAFGIVIRRGSWEAAMRCDEKGKWPLARMLMITGAGVGTIAGLLGCLLVEWGKQLVGQ